MDQLLFNLDFYKQAISYASLLLSVLFPGNSFINALISFKSTHLKNKIENISTLEGALYQREWAKINSSWIILNFFTL